MQSSTFTMCRIMWTYTPTAHPGCVSQAKYDFVDEMLSFSEVGTFTRMLDVGCGFGGSSRHIAKMFPNASIEGEGHIPGLRMKTCIISVLYDKNPAAGCLCDLCLLGGQVHLKILIWLKTCEVMIVTMFKVRIHQGSSQQQARASTDCDLAHCASL